jgi:hypothetical protein
MPLRLEDKLLQAVSENRRADVEALLKRGADPNAGLFGDHSALSIAVHNGNNHILDLLLHGGPIACMREQHESDQRAPPARVRVWVRSIGILFAKLSFATYVVRRLAVIVSPPDLLRTACLYGSYYLWFIRQHSIVSAVSSGTLRQRWLTPSTYSKALVDMAVFHQVVSFLIRCGLPAPLLPVPAPSLVRNLAVAIPLRFVVDATITVGHTLLQKGGLHRFQVWQRTSGQERWTGEMPHLADPAWRSLPPPFAHDLGRDGAAVHGGASTRTARIECSVARSWAREPPTREGRCGVEYCCSSSSQERGICIPCHEWEAAASELARPW